MECEHENFSANVNVVVGWKGPGSRRADVTVSCSQCGKAFIFPHTPLPEGVTDEEMAAGPWVARLPMTEVAPHSSSNAAARVNLPGTTPDPLQSGGGS